MQLEYWGPTPHRRMPNISLLTFPWELCSSFVNGFVLLCESSSGAMLNQQPLPQRGTPPPALAHSHRGWVTFREQHSSLHIATGCPYTGAQHICDCIWRRPLSLYHQRGKAHHFSLLFHSSGWHLALCFHLLFLFSNILGFGLDQLQSSTL